MTRPHHTPIDSNAQRDNKYKVLNTEARGFLERLWWYQSLDARCYSIVWISRDGTTKYRLYCIEPRTGRGSGGRDGRVLSVRDYPELYTKVLEDVGKLMGADAHIYFQVLPLSRAPEKGRGSASDVKVGRWLWADLDYKEVVEEAGPEGCEELEDHALRCYYSEGDKIIRVERPPLKGVLEDLEKIGLGPSIVVDSGAGYHIYWELEEEVDAKLLSRLEEELIDYLKDLGLPVDPKTKDLARILRLPGTTNPRVGRPVRVVYENQARYNTEELEEKLSTARGRAPRPRAEETAWSTAQSPGKELRELEDSKLIEVKELLKEAYKPGRRQHLVLYLSGWLAKAGVSPLSAVKLVKMLYEETGDTDPLKTRLSAVVYSYKKAGIDVDQYAEEIEEIAGVKPYGLEREIDESQIKGKTGLQEILEEALGEERALEIIRRVEEILGVSSPYRDSVIEILDYEKQLYAVANLRKLVVVRARRETDGLRYKERVAIGAPTAVEVYANPIGGITKYRVRWEAPTRPRPIEIGPAPVEDIVGRLVAEGLVVNRRLVHDVITAIIEGFIRKGKAVVKTVIEAPGFYLVDGKVIAVNVETTKPGPEELREALELLNDLASKWFKHLGGRFSIVVKWGLIAPFSYIYKQRGRWVPWLYLYGSSHTGKTTLGDIALSIWGLDSRYRKSGSNIDTPYRIGHVLSQSTFPVLINEPGAAISRDDIVEMIKNSVENLIVRGRYERGSYTEIPALAPLIFTSNRVLPRDDALLRRFLTIRFTYGERINQKDAGEFDEKVKPRLSKLSALGRYIASVVLEEPGVLEQGWEKAAEALLERAYREAGLEPPGWIRERPQAEDNIYEDTREAIRSFLVERFNDAYFRAAGRVEILRDEGISFGSRLEVSFEERVRIALGSGLVPWAFLKKGEDGDLVVFTVELARELEKRIGDIGGLKSIAELLGWGYIKVKLGDRQGRAMAVKLEQLIEFLRPKLEQ